MHPGIDLEQFALEPFPEVLQADAVLTQDGRRVIAPRLVRLPQPCFLKISGALLKARRQHGVPEVLRLGRFIGIGVGPFHFQHPDGGEAQELFNRLFGLRGFRCGKSRRSGGGGRDVPAEREQQGESQERAQQMHGGKERGLGRDGSAHSAVTVTSSGRSETGNCNS